MVDAGLSGPTGAIRCHDQVASHSDEHQRTIVVILRDRSHADLEYARSALKNGLKLEKELGVNSYKFVMNDRVIEIPTPRWTAYDAKYFNFLVPHPEVPMTTQERAYTSPIWYTPWVQGLFAY
jgi:hypothetical protein